MDNIKEWIEQHKNIVAIGCIVLVAFVAFSIFSYNNVHSSASTNNQTDSSSISEADALESDANSKLSQAQIAKRDSYSQDIKDFIGLLQSQMWAAGGEAPYLSFTDTTFSQTSGASNDQMSTTAYVVDVVEKKTIQASDPQTIVYTASVETADGNFFIELTREVSSDNSSSFSLASSGFMASQDEYTPIKPSERFNVVGLNSDALQLIDNKQEDLDNAVAEYCSQYLPTATNIAWDKTITIDWETNMITIPLTLDGTQAKSFYAFYDRTNHSFSVQSTSTNK